MADSSSLQTALAFWHGLGVDVAPANGPLAVAACEARLGCKMPRDVRQFYLTCDGVLEGTGRLYYEFMRLEDLGTEYIQDGTPKGLWAFVSWLQLCSVYAFEGSDADVETAPIWMVSTEDGRPLRVADDLAKFLDMVVRDDDGLDPRYQPAPKPPDDGS